MAATRNGSVSPGNERFFTPHSVKVSLRFMLLSLFSCVLIAFAIGRTARVFLLVNPQLELLLAHQLNLEQSTSPSEKPSVRHLKLPTPVLQGGKVVPQTTYTSKTFDTARSASINSRWVVTQEGKRQCVDVLGDECQVQSTPSPTNDRRSIDDNLVDDEVHLPQGQHLLIDIKNVNSVFLNSEELLANAMLELVDECGLTLLSYHCHGLTPMGVSCAGVLLESHVSFHTWPAEGVITLDLFTCGDQSLLPVIPSVEKLFSIPQVGLPAPQMIWAHKYRGFSEADDDEKSELTDFFNFPIGVMTDYKRQVVSAQTKFQRVDIVDVLRPHFQSMDDYIRSLSVDVSYESTHRELFEPDRMVFLDGVSQSRRTGDAAYHEALVHPALFAHENPKRVAIIGGGEGATLREILKHKSIEKVVMIEIDEQMVDLSRQYLPFWSDCSMLQGSVGSCFDDPRVEVYYEDAFAWFIDRFSGNGTNVEDPFDVIIMDALDPQVQKAFVDALYDGGPFLHSLPMAVSEDGIFVGQVGASPSLKSPPEKYSVNKNRVKFIESLVDLGFESIRDYDEGHGGFECPWQIIVAFKSYDTKADWFADPSMVNYKIRSRLIPTVSGTSPLLYFDGATMTSYKFPSKSTEVVFCRRDDKALTPACSLGHGYDPDRINIPTHTALEVRQSSLGENAGRGVFARQDIPKTSYIGMEDLVHSVHMSAISYELVLQIFEYLRDSREWKHLSDSVAHYAHWYGGLYSQRGRNMIMVCPTIHVFRNHGCNGTNNVGFDLVVTEETADPNVMPEELLSKYFDPSVIYNPALDRQVHYYSGGYPIRDIAKGEEILDNYLGMVGLEMEGWHEDIYSLREQCRGAMGEVSQLESVHKLRD